MIADNLTEIMQNALGAGILGGFMATLGAFAILFTLGFYIFAAFALMAIAKKTKTKNSWMAWIPIANLYLVTQMAKLNGLWTLILLAWFVPAVGGLIVAGVGIWMFWRIAERIKMPGWTSLLLIVPIVNLIVLGIYAWKK
jgi:hypothetical protein